MNTCFHAAPSLSERADAHPARWLPVGGSVSAMRLVIRSLLMATVCAGCGGGGTAGPDAASDAPGGTGPCGAEHLVTGELVDLDSTTAQPQGISNVRLTVEGMPARTAVTAPSGRFELCAPAAAAVTLDVDAPVDYLDGQAYIESEVLGGLPLSLRAYTQSRGAMLYSFDASRGHVLVFLAGDRSDLTLSRAHAAPLSGNDDDGDGVLAWAPGNVGRYVLFPNVDVSSPTILLHGDPMGPHTIPVAAGKLTLAAIFFVYF